MVLRGWKKAVAFLVGSLGVFLLVSALVYWLLADSVNKTIRESVLTYVRSRVTETALAESGGRLDVTLGDISYTYLTGQLEVRDVSVLYRDTTEESGNTITVAVPLVNVGGLFLWDILNGGGVSLGMISVTGARVTHKTWGEQAAPQVDSVVTLPKVPNVDSLLRKGSVALIPYYVQPLTVAGVEILDVHFTNDISASVSPYVSEFDGLSVRVGKITVDSTLPHVRPIASVNISINTWNRTFNDGRIIFTKGFDVVVSDRDSSLIVDSVAFFTPTEYTYSAAHLHFSYRESELRIGSVELGPTMPDGKYLGAQKYNTDRFRVSLSGLVLSGMDFPALSAQRALHVHKVDVSTLHLDILSNRSRTVDPRNLRPKMLNEIARSLPFQLGIDSVVLRNASIVYGEKWPYSVAPATLRWKNIAAEASNVSNAPSGAPFTIHARGTFQNQSTMEATFVIPLTASTYSLDAHGSLGKFDITALNEFLPIAENVKIRSGVARMATFSYRIRGNKCTGEVSPHYTGLKIDLLNKKTKEDGGILNSVVSFIANTFVVRSNNDGEDFRKGAIVYTLPADAAIMQTIWYPVRAGLTKAAGL